MKPILIKNMTFSNRTFTVEEREGQCFSYPYHYHPELELTLIVEGQGTRFVGNHIGRFESGDLVLIGKDLPHCWKEDEATSLSRGNRATKAIVLTFTLDLNGTHLFDLPEHEQIRQLINNATKGIQITGNSFYKVEKLMLTLLQASGNERILLLLQILDVLSGSSDLHYLNTDRFYDEDDNDLDRMRAVYNYIDQNYLNDISLPEAANIANMHASAFCRYFKKRYGKSFISIVSELRIAHACKQLINDDINIAEVCYKSGYNNVSNFAKTFKKVMGVSPKEYKNHPLKKYKVA